MDELIYLGSPYTHIYDFIQKLRYMEVMRAVHALHQNNIYTFSPILYLHCLVKSFNKESGVDTWIEFDSTFLNRSDGFLVYKLPGWEHSLGLRKELELWSTRKPSREIRELSLDNLSELESSTNIKFEDLPFFN